jgi:hypothetical protein
MKNFIIAFIFFQIFNYCLFGADDNSAKNSEKDVSFGIGTNISPANLYVPVQFGEHLRLEPMIGISISNTTYSRDTLSNSIADIQRNSIKVGIGGFYTFEPIKSSKVYAGIRFTYINSINNSYGVDVSNLKLIPNEFKQNSYTVGACFGTEYFFVKQFSLGIEAQLNYLYLMKPILHNHSYDFIYSSYKGQTISNSTLVFLRYYFDY